MQTMYGRQCVKNAHKQTHAPTRVTVDRVKVVRANVVRVTASSPVGENEDPVYAAGRRLLAQIAKMRAKPESTRRASVDRIVAAIKRIADDEVAWVANGVVKVGSRTDAEVGADPVADAAKAATDADDTADDTADADVYATKA